MLLRPHKDVVVVAGALKDGGEACSVPERIGVEADRDVDIERLPAIAFAIQGMADEALGSRYVAVRLNGPPADDLPSAFTYARSDLSKHLRRGPLHPAVMLRRGVAVAEVRVLVQAVERAAKCIKNGIGTVTPRPEPRGVNVRVANHVNDLSGVWQTRIGLSEASARSERGSGCCSDE